MRAAGESSPRSRLGGRAVTFLLCLGCATSWPVGRAGAEVWPASAASLLFGAEALVGDGVLGVVENPGLSPWRPGWSLGAARLEPYGVSEFARWDLVACRGLGAAGVSLAWSQLGREVWGARTLVAGAATRGGTDRLALGLALRRTERGRRAAWSSDLGLRAQPEPELEIGLAARSVWRGGQREIAPEAQWGVGVVWSPEPLALGLLVLRDAVGPIESRWTARLSLGPLDTHLAFADRVGDETRVALALSLRAGALRVAAGQEGGRVLPETRAVAAEWNGTNSASRRAGSQLEWGIAAGAVGSGTSGLGLHGGVAWSHLDASQQGFVLAAAASRDPGEPGGLDEGRGHLRLQHRRWGGWQLGALDRHVGRGLVVSRDGGATGPRRGALATVENGADLVRSPVGAPQGVAASWGEPGGARLLVSWARLDRDARLVASGLWPTGGRLHRTERERARRGALREDVGFLCYERRVAPSLRLAATVVTARYGGVAARLVPGGGRRNGGRWFSTAGEWRGVTAQSRWEAALDEVGRGALSLHLRAATARRRPRLRLELALERAPPGFTAATAWPSLARFTNLFARAELVPLTPAWSLTLARRLEERWLLPTATRPGRRQWVRQTSLVSEHRAPWGSLAFETALRAEHRLATDGASSDDLWTPTRHLRWGVSWTWRPAAGMRLRLRPAWSRSSAGWRESWTVSLRGGERLAWAIETLLRPGGVTELGAEDLEGDPLGGYRLTASGTPTRLRVRVARGAAEMEFRWRETSGGPRPELWLRLRGAANGGLW